MTTLSLPVWKTKMSNNQRSVPVEWFFFWWFFSSPLDGNRFSVSWLWAPYKALSCPHKRVLYDNYSSFSLDKGCCDTTDISNLDGPLLDLYLPVLQVPKSWISCVRAGGKAAIQPGCTQVLAQETIPHTFSENIYLLSLLVAFILGIIIIFPTVTIGLCSI